VHGFGVLGRRSVKRHATDQGHAGIPVGYHIHDARERHVALLRNGLRYSLADDAVAVHCSAYASLVIHGPSLSKMN
jgi:hypothetical protein